MTETPFYLDWTFWTMVVATIALILSQLPPLIQLIKRSRIEVECFNIISLTHTMGNPNATLYISFQNVGGSEIKVESVTLKFSHADGDIFEIPGQTYFPTLESKNSVIMPPFRIKPQEAWEHSIVFFKRFNREDDKLYRSIGENLKLNISEKKLKQVEDEYVIADEGLVKPAIDFFNQRFKWKDGEYKVEVTAKTIPNSASVSKNFRFTLFESDTNVLKKYIDDYKYGLGVYYYDSQLHGGIGVSLIQN